MRKDLFKTLFARMLTTYLLVILLLLLLVGVTVSSMFHNQYMLEQEESLRKEAARINISVFTKYVDVNDRGLFNEEMKITARHYDALIQIIDPRGIHMTFHDELESEEKWGPLAYAFELSVPEGEPPLVSMPGLDIHPSLHEMQRKGPRRFFSFESRDSMAVTEQGAFFYNLFSELTDMPTLTYVRAAYNGGFSGVILMHIDLTGVNASITQVYMDVLLIALLAVLVAVLVVYYLTTRITKPIMDMNATVRKYSEGSFELRLNDQGADEVAQLAHSFNVMAGELAALEHTRKSFVANVSHELRSPLTSISGFLEAIQDGTIPGDRQGEYIGLVIQETKRMTGMVNNLLDLARIESGQTPLHLSRFDINELALRTLLTFEARISSKSLDLKLMLMQPGCFVEADQDQIAQVLRNLIDNAIKFTPDGGRLTITTKLQDRQRAAVSVTDSGCGISEEDVPHVFTRFYKAEKAHTPSAQSGTGLGLSIVRVILNRHEQDIWVTSKLTEGTTFTFTLKYLSDLRRRVSDIDYDDDEAGLTDALPGASSSRDEGIGSGLEQNRIE